MILRPFFSLSSKREEKFLIPSTVEAFNFVRCLDHSGKLESSEDQTQKAATALLRDKLQEQDFARPISLRASRILGTVSRLRFV